MIDLVVSDIQWPYHNKALTDEVLKLAQSGSFGRILCVGDEADMIQVAGWSRGYPEEFITSLQTDIAGAKDYMRALSESAPVHVMRSNHTRRLSTYIRRHAPALESLAVLSYPTLMGYTSASEATRRSRLVYHPEPWRFHPDMVLAHGDEGSLNKVAGRTAGLLAEQWRTGVVCGHTHRQGIQPFTRGIGSTETYWAIEAGHLMDVQQADYLEPGKSTNWQAGIAVLYHTRSGSIVPQLVPAIDGKLYTQHLKA